jgi:hypothetical protein
MHALAIYIYIYIYVLQTHKLVAGRTCGSECASVAAATELQPLAAFIMHSSYSHAYYTASERARARERERESERERARERERESERESARARAKRERGEA